MNKLSMMPIALVLSSLLTAPASFAQPITPAADGTNTTVTPQGNQFNITGGTLSGDRANLFHSFEEFGLDGGQVANFLSSPEIQNILGRVTGGDASIINGLIQITGGQSNLFLINPAGILFGPHASLNVPASFTATTATGIGFGNDRFQAVGENNWANLVGTPSQFAFDISQPGAIVNLGNLTLSGSHDLTLLGGTVFNAGTLSAPGGNITIAAVPGESRVRISQENHLLSLDLTPSGTTALTSQVTPLSLPELLTGSGVSHATQMQVNPDGTITLTGSQQQISIQLGDAITSGEIDVVGEAGGIVQVLGQRVAVVDGAIDASGITGGGTVLIGGEYQGKGPVPNALHTVVSQDSIISANALSQGDGGRVLIWSDDTTAFYGTINAQGGIEPGNVPQNGGFIEVSGKKNLMFSGLVDLSALYGNAGTLLLDPENVIIISGSAGTNDSELNADFPLGQAQGVILAEDGTGDYTISELALESLPGSANVILEATNDITIENLPDNWLNFQVGTGSMSFVADADNNGTGSFIMQNLANTIGAPGRNIFISGASITAGDINTESDGIVSSDGGSISLAATNGTIQAGMLAAGVSAANVAAGNSGTVTLEATQGISIEEIHSWSQSGLGNSGNAGRIDIRTTEGDLSITGSLISFSVSNQGGNGGDGGDIFLEASQGNINIDGGIWTQTSGSLNEPVHGGNIEIFAGNTIHFTAEPPDPESILWVIDTGGTDFANAGTITFTAE
ncbi:MAG TPA: filamentous hemagglutinin N-terminal domain-containing protein, partial [Vampirovibrionales bacterium]